MLALLLFLSSFAVHRLCTAEETTLVSSMYYKIVSRHIGEEANKKLIGGTGEQDEDPSETSYRLYKKYFKTSLQINAHYVFYYDTPHVMHDLKAIRNYTFSKSCSIVCIVCIVCIAVPHDTPIHRLVIRTDQTFNPPTSTYHQRQPGYNAASKISTCTTGCLR